MLRKIYRLTKKLLYVLSTFTIGKFHTYSIAKLPWEELDREEQVLANSASDGSGLKGVNGLLGFNPDYPGWQGGSIRFPIQLTNSNGDYHCTLNQPFLDTSCRLTRKAGSEAVLRMSMHKDLVFDKSGGVQRFVNKYIVILDRVYKAIFAKDVITYIEVAAVVREGLVELVDPSTLTDRHTVRSYEEWLDWQNPVALNSKQVRLAVWLVLISILTVRCRV